ncbi:MAG: hypothetical protein A07HR60_00356 [uncultured archaeon A07HR60]|nr:MAG: hypothetical protein A07HR60_00356 [uncultured archaeon A07HR60]
MRCAAAGNLLTLKTATSGSQQLLTHHRSPPSSSWHVVSKDSPRVGATESQADGPACCSRCWTPVSATLPTGAGNSERIPKNTTPCEGPKLPQRTRKFTAAAIGSAG